MIPNKMKLQDIWMSRNTLKMKIKLVARSYLSLMFMTGATKQEQHAGDMVTNSLLSQFRGRVTNAFG